MIADTAVTCAHSVACSVALWTGIVWWGFVALVVVFVAATWVIEAVLAINPFKSSEPEGAELPRTGPSAAHPSGPMLFDSENDDVAKELADLTRRQERTARDCQ